MATRVAAQIHPTRKTWRIPATKTNSVCAPAGGFAENDPQQGAPGANPSSDADYENAAEEDEERAGDASPDEMDAESGDESTSSARTMLSCHSTPAPTTAWFCFLSILLLRIRRAHRSEGQR
jgi:hypothetical protein